MKVKLINEPITSDYGASLLRARGIRDIEKFLNPDESCLQDFGDLDHISDGVRSIEALTPNARIGLIIDCDVDGFTSAAIIYQYLKRLVPEINIDCYLHEGKAHGLEEHIEIIQSIKYDLIIIPDAGSNDSQYAKKIDCPILIIDHHLVEDSNFSPNMTIINNQLSSDYKNKNLSGAGVTYQFCRALDEHFSVKYSEDYIDLAALGVCGDMMSGLEVENQYLWRKGFSQIKNYFFMTLVRKQGYSITGKVGATDKEIIAALNPTSVAFYIVPLINAMIRVGSKEEKERLWLAFIDGHMKVPSNKRGAKGQLEEVAVESTRECVNSRSHQNKIKEEAVSKVEQKILKYGLLDNKILFIQLDEDDSFPSELNGLLAMQLSAKYKRPTIVARLNNEGYIRGSIRGLNHSELNSFKDYLDSTKLCEYVIGHDNAAGISISETNLSKLISTANQDLKDFDFGEDFYEVQFVRQAYSSDLANLIEDISNYKFCWSTLNEEPYIYIKDLHFSAKDIQIMGKTSNTIKIVKNGIAYMKFFADDMIEELHQYGDNIRMEVVGRANLNYWMGTITPQIFIENYEIKEEKLTDF